MKKVLLFAAFLCFCLTLATAQEDTTVEAKPERMIPRSTFVPQTIVHEKEVIAYPHVREADVVWSKTVWRIIDCREKMNYPLYYPTTALNSRKSLVQALVDGVKSGKVQAYDDDEFTAMLTPTEVTARFDASDRTMRQEKMDGTGDTTIFIKGEVNWGEVREFIVKEQWFFDRHYSQLFVRIVGICPTRVYSKTLTVSDEEEIEGQVQKMKLFWVYFPEARRVLANTLCFAGNNTMAQISFDDLFHKRRFSSYIVAEDNSLNDRRISDYSRNGIQSIMESERIKREIMNFESDLWEY